MDGMTNRGGRLLAGGKRVVAAAVIALGVLTLSACNTTEGAGKDIKSLGAGIEEEAREAKD